MARSRSASASPTPRSQIGVAIEPGSTIETLMPHGRQLLAEDVADRLEPELGRVVGAEHLDRHQAADRGDEDDPATGGADRGQHRLRHRDLGGEVDVELTAEVLDRQRLQRPRDRDAGVVDQAVEAGAVCVLRNPTPPPPRSAPDR